VPDDPLPDEESTACEPPDGDGNLGPMVFGEIPGQSPGTTYPDYAAMIAAGVHRQNTVGMVGGAKTGTELIVLNGGYKDDLDLGSEIIYTGAGKRDSRGNQIRGARAKDAYSPRMPRAMSR
jgi:hypothetical protein